MEWHIVLGEVVIRAVVRIHEAAIEAMAVVDLSRVADVLRGALQGLPGL